jgi:hypothetical protein
MWLSGFESGILLTKPRQQSESRLSSVQNLGFRAVNGVNQPGVAGSHWNWDGWVDGHVFSSHDLFKRQKFIIERFLSAIRGNSYRFQPTRLTRQNLSI